jgi:hypothetical protein
VRTWAGVLRQPSLAALAACWLRTQELLLAYASQPYLNCCRTPHIEGGKRPAGNAIRQRPSSPARANHSEGRTGTAGEYETWHVSNCASKERYKGQMYVQLAASSAYASLGPERL